MTSRNRRAVLARLSTIVLAVTLAASCTDGARRRGPALEEMARTLGADVVERLARGYVPGRSGEILLVPAPWNVLSQWNGGLQGPDDPRTTHATPWSYHQRVPISLYGPGYIRPGGRSDRPVDVADLAPTLAELLGTPFEAPDGEVLRDALVPDGRRAEPPRAIVVVVVDGGGWNVLEQWPDAWPVQRRLMRSGTTYTNATIGSAPAVTAPIHSTIGTGAYPRVHGIAENTARMPDGSIGDVAFEEADLRLMSVPTIADTWDALSSDRAWVGMIGYESWHLGMMGRGGDAGDRDVAVLWDQDEERFWTNEDRYVLPDYLPPRSELDRRVRELDASDGALDEMWRGTSLSELSYQFTATPAYAAYVGDATLAIAREAPIGDDAVTDLLFVEMKTGDVAGHVWNMLGQEVEVVLRTQDDVLGELVRILDERVGRGRYVLALTADHGQTPLPEEVDGLRIDRFELLQDINDEFGDVVETVHPSDLYLRPGALAEAGVTAEEIARWIADYRYGDGLPEGLDASTVPEGLLDARVFAAALPGAFLESLSPPQIRDLGAGRYPEGDLATPPPVGL